MKRFVLRLTIYSLIMLVLLLICNWSFQKIKYRGDARYTEDKFLSIPQSIYISNLGNSHGVYAFDYSGSGQEDYSFNFALTAQSLSYDYRILQQYEDNLCDEGVMFIVVSFFSLGFDEEAQKDFDSKNNRYYLFLEPQYIKNFTLSRYARMKFFDVFFQDIDVLVYDIKNQSKKGQDLFEQGGKEFDYAKDAERAFERHMNLLKSKDCVVNEEELEALRSIIAVCKSHNVRPVLVTTPYREEYSRLFDDDYLHEFFNTIDNICSEEDIDYYDYSRDIRFTNSDEYMRNADHLTPSGAELFTKDLLMRYGIAYAE